MTVRGTLGGERSSRGDEGGLAGGNIVGGNPVEGTLTRMKVASLLIRGREVKSGSSILTSVTQWRRCDLVPCLEGQERMACSKVSVFKPQWGQEGSPSGVFKVSWAAR